MFKSIIDFFEKIRPKNNAELIMEAEVTMINNKIRELKNEIQSARFDSKELKKSLIELKNDIEGFSEKTSNSDANQEKNDDEEQCESFPSFERGFLKISMSLSFEFIECIKSGLNNLNGKTILYSGDITEAILKNIVPKVEGYDLFDIEFVDDIFEGSMVKKVNFYLIKVLDESVIYGGDVELQRYKNYYGGVTTEDIEKNMQKFSEAFKDDKNR